MRNKDLESKLRAIQDLKSEKYIGTKQAWNYIKRITGLYDNPLIVADAINKNLKESGKVYYPATPERIVVLGDLMDIIVNDIYINDGEIDDGRIDDFIELKNNSIINCIEIITNSDITYDYSKGINGDIESLIEELTPLYRRVQFNDIDNRIFALNAFEYVTERESNFKLDEDTYNLIRDTDWDEIFSLEELRRIERKEKKRIFISEIKISDRINLMINDRVEHRLENRREILTDYIELMRGNEDDYTLDYDSLLKHSKMNYKYKNTSLKRLIESSMPDSLIHAQTKTLERYKFLFHIVASEKNFIKRYLES